MKKISVVLVLLVLATTLFWWFEIRPRNIKKECNAWAGNRSGFDRIDGKTGKNRAEYTKKIYDDLYSRCTREKGL